MAPKAVLEPSILTSIMRRCGAEPGDYSATSYAEDFMQSINASLSALYAAGVGPEGGLTITSEEETWDMLTDNETIVAVAREYVYLRAKLVFDPPPAAAIELYEKMAVEALRRSNQYAEGII